MDGKVALLAAMRVFDGWTLTELRRLARAADLVDVVAGETLVRAGAWHAGCYILLSGAVATTAPDGDSVAMRPSRVLAFTTNGFFGAIEQIPSLGKSAMQHSRDPC